MPKYFRNKDIKKLKKSKIKYITPSQSVDSISFIFYSFLGFFMIFNHFTQLWKHVKFKRNDRLKAYTYSQIL